MSDEISRRKMLAGASAFSGLLLTGCDTTTYLPPHLKHGVGGIGEALNMMSHRICASEDSLAPEYSAEAITPHFPVEGTAYPESKKYQRQLKDGFKDWRLEVGGLVAKELSISLDELKQMPSRTQITSQSCEKGWTAIAQWTGVPLSHILELAGGARPSGRYIEFRTVDGWQSSIDMNDALHAQTILAYGMNGKPLPIQHGAPVRVRVERQMGYKSLKYLTKIDVIERPDGPGESGWHWYAGA